MASSRIITFRRKRSRLFNTLRALLRDSSALLREFQRPILVFLVVTIAGGYVYGELHALAGRPPIALIDRPYIMLQLMILETPYDVPPEWYLVIFWYALPLILIFIVGNGVADFVRLFFNRDGRRAAWREALVSTYRRHVIVFGAGHVGLRVVRTLAEMGIDVVVVDNSPDKEKDFVLNELGVPVINGDGRETAVLMQAGLRDAAAVVACTGNDHTNLEAIMKVRQINANVRVIARVWDDNLGAQMKQFLKVDAIISSSGLSAPVFAGMALGAELTQTIHIDGDDYSTLKLVVSQNSFLRGRTVGDVQRKDNCDIVLHVHDGKSEVQPAHDVLINAGDTLVIFARHERTLHLAARNYEGIPS
jgi:trk system potassium uptake protein TrkA